MALRLSLRGGLAHKHLRVHTLSEARYLPQRDRFMTKKCLNFIDYRVELRIIHSGRLASEHPMQELLPFN